MCKIGSEKPHPGTEGQSKRHLHWHPAGDHAKVRLAGKYHNMWWNMDFPVWSWNEEAVDALEVTCISKNEKSKDEQVRTEGNANFSFSFYIRGVLMVVGAWRSDSKPTLIHWGFDQTEGMREEEATKFLEEQLLDAASGQCPSSQRPFGQEVSCRWMHSNVWTSSIFAGFGTLWYFLFPKMKSVLTGIRFPSVDEMKAKTARLLNGIGVDELQHCF